MPLYTIADLHLSLGENTDKPMEIFGARWQDHHNKIKERWSSLVEENDTVIIPGDISWALKLEEAAEDFRFIDSLPGTKIIGRGNHDYWWATERKNSAFFNANGITTVKQLHNNSYEVENIVVCGSRGWFYDGKNAPANTDHAKIVAREVGRLKLSLDSAASLSPQKKRVVFLHFPPVFGQFVCREIIDLMHVCGITECYYGHIHGRYELQQETEYEGIVMRLISADYLGFTPYRIN